MGATLQDMNGHHAVVGGMTIETASTLLAGGLAAMQAGGAVFDLGQVADVDSAGLAVIFGWQRAANAAGKSLRIANTPASLISLAEVYGVSDLLPPSVA